MTPSIDWDQLSFSMTPTQSMYLTTCKSDGTWKPGRLEPYGNLSISPAAGVLNYGQGIFEGMKAYRTKNDEIVLFRPDENAKRFYQGAKRICIPPVPEDMFIDAVSQIVLDNQAYIPPYSKGSLYIRPLLIGSGIQLGCRPASEYTFIIYVSPVGNYYRSELKPIDLLVSTEAHRAAPKGMGDVKYIGNYAACYTSTKEAQKKGYDACIYLDAENTRYVEEVSTANVFFYQNTQLITPKLGTILPGITRDSVIQLANAYFNLKVIEKKIAIEKALEAEECFATGTAVTVAPIGSIDYQGKKTVFNQHKMGEFTQKVHQLYKDIQLGETEDRFGWVIKL